MKKEEIIKYRRERAKETLEDAKILFENKRLRSTVNRIYYALFYEVTALLFSRNLSSPKHSGIISIFNKEFIKKKIVPIELGKFYNMMYQFRHMGDYEDFIEFDEEDVKKWLDKAKNFLKEIEKLF